MEKSKVYVLVDAQSRILRCDGGYTAGNIKAPENWVLIDAGYGDRYNLCQNHYFDRLLTQDGIPRYELCDGAPRLRSREAQEADRQALPQEPSLAEKVDALTAQNEMLTECLLELSQLLYE